MENSEVPVPRYSEIKGPLKNRSCTDIPCLLIFLAFIGCWIGVGYYALKNGDIETLLAPTDDEGRRCGIDSEVAEKPYLVFFDLTRCFNSRCNTPQMCVEKCPSTNWYLSKNNTNDLAALKKNLLCKPGINLSNKQTKEEIENLFKKQACAPWYLKSQPIVGRCLPTKIPSEFADDYLTDKALKQAREILDYLFKAEGIVDKAMKTKEEVLLIICGSTLMCLIFIASLEWIALPCVTATIFGVIGLLGYLGYLSWLEYEKNRENGEPWKIVAIILGSIAAIIALFTCCLWSRIYLACQLIKEASKAVMAALTTLFFPIAPWLLQLSLVVYFVVVAICLFSIGEQTFTIEVTSEDSNLCKCPDELNYTANALCDPKIFNDNCKENNEPCISQGCHLQKVKGPEFMKYLYSIHIVGGIWLFCFITALGEMILAATFATWYWTKKKSNLPFFTLFVSVWRTFRYHLGTVAFGAVIITIVRCFRIILEYLHAQTRQPGNVLGWFSQAVYTCCKCFLMVLEKFLKFMNRNAYIMCAIYGKGLCTSATDAVSLIVRNVLRVVVLNKIVDWLLFAGKILVTCTMAAGTWYYYTLPENDDGYWYVPVIFVSIGSYLVASVFFSVHEMAIDTIFLCFLEDCERHDGSPEKPYFMSRKLAKLLRLQNNSE